jgi:hypothetical protein
MPSNQTYYGNVLDLDTLDETDDGVSSGQSAHANVIAVAVAVTTFTGSNPTLDLEVEWSPNGTTWGSAETPDTLAQITGTGVFFLRVDVKAPKWRLTYAIGGTTVVLDFRVDALLIP